MFIDCVLFFFFMMGFLRGEGVSETGSLYVVGWPGTYLANQSNPKLILPLPLTVPPPRLLGLQACTTTPSINLFLFFIFYSAYQLFGVMDFTIPFAYMCFSSALSGSFAHFLTGLFSFGV